MSRRSAEALAHAARQRAILARLERSGGAFVSGAEIAAELGISRNAVSKRVRSLRASGWRIEAVTRRGYRLVSAPDSLEPLLVGRPDNRWLGIADRYHYRASVGSTNDEAIALAEAGAPHGTLVVADEQTAGRGRMVRSWHSPPGSNLYLSVVLRPQLAPVAAPPLSLTAAVAVADALAGLDRALRPVVKWPNDLLLGGRKVAGILLELTAELDRIRHVVLGVGINVDVDASQLPVDVRAVATSLGEHRGAPVARARVLGAVLASLEVRIDQLEVEGPPRLIKAWLGYADWLGKPIVVRTHGGEVRGVAVGLDPSGTLQLRDDRGRQRSIVAGDVSLVGLSERRHDRR